MFALAELLPEVIVLIYCYVDYHPKTGNETVSIFINALAKHPVLYKEAAVEYQRAVMIVYPPDQTTRIDLGNTNWQIFRKKLSGVFNRSILSE